MNFAEKNLVPFFQPIVSIENNKIFGYEVLGRNIEGGKIKSLGEFFCDESVDSNSKLSVDRIIRKKAIEQFYKLSDQEKHLFINMRLEWIANYASNPEEMPTVKWLREKNIAFDRVIIEISESNFNSTADDVIMGLSYYRSLGMKIAIDDYGKEGSNIYRLAEICPDMIKIDMSFVQKSEDLYQYRDYLENVTEFANKLGIEVVYEGVENDRQLTNCINSSGRYFQGFYLSEPQDSMIDKFSEVEMKNCFIKNIINFESRKSKSENLRKKLDAFVDECKNYNVFCKEREDTDEKFTQISDIIPAFVKRIYICNKYGFQITSNIEVYDGVIELIDNYNKNWAWRGYFRDAVNEICEDKKSYITHSYIDISTKEKIYTYVYMLDSTTYLFIDVSKDEIG